MYFPSFYENNIDCGQCDKGGCMCRGLHQRNAYPFVHVEIGEESADLNVSIPGDKKTKKVYHSGFGSWYYRTKDEDGNKIKRIIRIGVNHDYEDFISYGRYIHADYFLLPCEITDYLA
jgi:hypothetical protein